MDINQITEHSSSEETREAIHLLVKKYINYRNYTKTYMYDSREFGCHRSQCEFGCNCNLSTMGKYGGLKKEYRSTEHMLSEEVNNPDICVKNLAKCDCCKKHQINKPTEYQSWIETAGPEYFKSPECKCNCRHLSRFLCRSYNCKYYPTKESPQPNNILNA